MTQRREVLQTANRIRIYRALFKCEITQGKRDLVKVLVSPPSETLTMRIDTLLMAERGVGRVTATRMLKKANASAWLPVGKLTVRQRRALGEAIQTRQARRVAA